MLIQTESGTQYQIHDGLMCRLSERPVVDASTGEPRPELFRNVPIDSVVIVRASHHGTPVMVAVIDLTDGPRITTTPVVQIRF